MTYKKRKNVLIIMSDEQRVDTLGCYGNPAAKTPHIDALAEAGVRFDNCFTPYPLCCPARASLWTGLLPHRHHVVGNWLAIKPELRDGGIIQSFAESGYHTIYNGKWHVPGTNPKRAGYRSWDAIPAVLDGKDRGRYIEEYRAYVKAQGYALVEKHIENLTDNDLKKKTKNGQVDCGTADIQLEHYLETWQTDKFLKQLEGRPEDQPFFAVCSFNAPHFPMIVPEPYDRLNKPEDVILPPNFLAGIEGKPREVLDSIYYQHTCGLDEAEWRKLIAHYWGFCSLVDAQTGKIIQWLKEKGEYENTIIVYTSDHGDMIGSHGMNHKSWQMHYDETLRVPLLLVHPDEQGGRSVAQKVSLMDIMPTLAELSGVELDRDMDGKSFTALMDGSKEPFRQYLLAETFENCHQGAGQHIDPEDAGEEFRAPNLSIRTDREKYIFHWKDHDEYYDYTTDPYENVNRHDGPEMRDRILELQKLIVDEIKTTGPKLAGLVEKRMKEKQRNSSAIFETTRGGYV